MKKIRILLTAVLALTGVYLYALPAPNLPYAIAVLTHLGAGLLLTLFLLPFLFGGLRDQGPLIQLGWPLLGIGALTGIALMVFGNPASMVLLFYLHIIFCILGLLLLLPEWLNQWTRMDIVLALLLPILLAIGLAVPALYLRHIYWQQDYVISNNPMPPATMEEEAGGSDSPFFPSSAETADGKLIPSDFFLESQACDRCHADVVAQWSESAHRFSSFNNQWYRKSVEYMQQIAGVRASKWCAGCHDPALLFSGKMDTPITEQIDAPESHAGLACVSCHSIIEVSSTMGQGDYVLEYPLLHELATSETPWIRQLHDFLVEVNPEPHRRVFLKPFMRRQPSEFCVACHKVHLDKPLNDYRWIRGFNEYDNWQASGVSGQGARSFYYPPRPQTCVDCHMPQVTTEDSGSSSGRVRSHRFAAANSALPTANQDEDQLAAVRSFIESGVVTVDIFGLSPAGEATITAEDLPGQLSTTFAVGEEAETAVTGVETEPAPLTAPLGEVETQLQRGETYRVDVVVRTRTVGHFFPGGTVDAYDLWLELKATDNEGHLLFWSGQAEDEERGPVEDGAHFYRALLIDGHGNPINKRNAWAARSVVYVRLIPPGAADTVHFRLRVPETTCAEVVLEARLRYRKFSWANTRFAYAGVRDPAGRNPDTAVAYDDAEWSFDGDTSNVSGELKQVPNLPVLTLAESVVKIPVAEPGQAALEPAIQTEPNDWERWNDYGIGLLLQGDLRGAERAFRMVTEAAPGNPDGWVNLGRVAVQEGNHAAADEALRHALTIEPKLARAHFFLAKVLKDLGKYDEALASLAVVTRQYPRDRVALNETGRILFLQTEYEAAAEMFERTLAIDPENLQAHYNLMLAYRGLGDEARSEEHQKRFLRFKFDEASQAISGPYRLEHPEDNRERQPVHEHTSVPIESVHVSGGGR